MTTNPFILLSLIGVTTVVVFACRGDQPWSRSFRIYLWLGLFIVLIRVFFRIVFGGTTPGEVWLDLPVVPLPEWTRGLVLLGPVTREGLLAGLYDGLRLAAIVICIGAANSLANPKRLLRSVPPALYEIGTALVVSVTVLPQFAASVQRVRMAQRLRAGEGGRVRGLRRLVVPVLEDALDRSMALAAGMDTRGYGRSGGATPAQRRRTGSLMLLGLAGICVGVYATLDTTTPRLLAAPMLLVGLAFAVAGLISAGSRVVRTRYRPDPWRWPEFAVLGCGIVVASIGVWISERQPGIAVPQLDGVPQLSLLSLAGVAAALAVIAVVPPPKGAGS